MSSHRSAWQRCKRGIPALPRAFVPAGDRGARRGARKRGSARPLKRSHRRAPTEETLRRDSDRTKATINGGAR